MLEVNNKSILLSKILAIDIFFFSKNKEEIFPSGRVQYSLEQKKIDESTAVDKGPSWYTSNKQFGDVLQEIN